MTSQNEPRKSFEEGDEGQNRKENVDIPIENNNKIPLPALHQAAVRFDYQSVVKLLAQGDDPNGMDEAGRTPGHCLVSNEILSRRHEKSALACLQALCTHESDINARDSRSETLLSLAVHHKLERLARFLIQNGANATVRTRIFPTAHSLATAIAKDLPDIMVSIFDSGVKLEEPKDDGTHSDEATIISLDWRKVIQYSPPEGDILLPFTGSRETLIEEEFLDASLVDRMKVHTQVRIETVKHKLAVLLEGGQEDTSFLYSLLDLEAKDKFLSHPLVLAFLHWKNQEHLRFVKLLKYSLIVIPVIYVALMNIIYFQYCKLGDITKDDQSGGSGGSSEKNNSLTIRDKFGVTLECKISARIAIFCLVTFILILASMSVDVWLWIRLGVRYGKLWKPWVLRFFFGLALVTVWPGVHAGRFYDIGWLYPFVSIGIFLAIGLLLVIAQGFMEDSQSLLHLPTLLHLPFYFFTLISNTFNAGFIVVIGIVLMNFILGAYLSNLQELQRNLASLGRVNRVMTLHLVDFILPFRHSLISCFGKEGEEYKLQLKFDANDKDLNLKLLTDDIRTEIISLVVDKYPVYGEKENEQETDPNRGAAHAF